LVTFYVTVVRQSHQCPHVTMDSKLYLVIIRPPTWDRPQVLLMSFVSFITGHRLSALGIPVAAADQI